MLKRQDALSAVAGILVGIPLVWAYHTGLISRPNFVGAQAVATPELDTAELSIAERSESSDAQPSDISEILQESGLVPQLAAQSQGRLQQAEDSFAAAVRYATDAAQRTQTAQTTADWEMVAIKWDGAIATLGIIPKEAKSYTLAQEKIQEYQHNLEYAQKQAAAQP